jgi:Uma2 family endonuclease
MRTFAMAVQEHPLEGRENTLATGVSFEDWLRDYADTFTELENGVVNTMSPVQRVHSNLSQFFIMFLNAYLAERPIGMVQSSPFVMRTGEKSGHEPDIMVILHETLIHLTETFMGIGADLCIEIVSPESVARDYGTKLGEYEIAGVNEYIIIDPQRKAATFYQRTEEGLFKPASEDRDGNYAFATLPGLKLPVAILWRDPLPNFAEIGRLVEKQVCERL